MTQKYISNLFGKAHFKVAALLLLRALGAVLGTGLHTALHALSVQSAADDVVTHTREVLHTATADHDHRVLLQGMTDAGDVSGDLIAIGEADTGDLTKSGVRLLRGRSTNCGANATLLGRGEVGLLVLQRVKTILQSRGVGLVSRLLSALANQLVKSRHSCFSFPEMM